MSEMVKEEYKQIEKNQADMTEYLQVQLQDRSDELADLNDRYVGLQVRTVMHVMQVVQVHVDNRYRTMISPGTACPLVTLASSG